MTDAETRSACLKAARELRDSGLRVESYFDLSKLKKQFNYANKKGIPFVVTVGPEELTQGNITLKDMISGQQKTVTISEAGTIVRKALSEKGK